MSSLKAYVKVDENEQARLEACRRTRKRITIISLSSMLLVAIVVGAVVGTGVFRKNPINNDAQQAKSISTAVKAVCDVTLYKDSCYNSLAPVAKSGQLKPEDLFKLSMQMAFNELSKASQRLRNDASLSGSVTENKTISELGNCRDLLSLAMDHLNNSLYHTGGNVLDAVDDLRTWLSSVATYQQTCIDELEDGKLKATLQAYLLNSAELTSNSLAIITWIYRVASSMKMRRLLNYNTRDKTPKWFHPKDRKLVQSSSDFKRKADAVVAKDGTGKYKTIGAALKSVSDKSSKRFVIYVKKGVYVENVRVEKSKWNVMIVGDGMNTTIVSGKLNFVDGTPTFSTATFAVFGKGFIARDMGFRNTAGAIKHQAVALMSTADQSIFYRCSFDAFQDTLYAHSNRQFYRECDIYGTVDFIFGNSAVVFQNCNIFPRQPLNGQKNTITAQGRFDPNQNTGISVQNCTILPFGNLKSVQTYLGRPWKNYSTTIFMQSMMGSLIDPSGWLPWTGNTAPPTIFYVEYQNLGPGASTKKRVHWKGLKTNVANKVVTQYTTKSFIQGGKWIQDTGTTYKNGL
ncbi:hypothetical protein K2173_025084 [Erythroxylum novogranatense]|uniref:Pectinesterase n=1 Tax=Erythroxylum novogranatense TaxID=1862640 RepID=A0AAV8SVK7_9ROSI|nr:hypothetical protein K2173_025084 [Erythroxylum novogranatense]